MDNKLPAAANYDDCKQGNTSHHHMTNTPFRYLNISCQIVLWARATESVYVSHLMGWFTSYHTGILYRDCIKKLKFWGPRRCLLTSAERIITANILVENMPWEKLRAQREQYWHRTFESKLCFFGVSESVSFLHYQFNGFSRSSSYFTLHQLYPAGFPSRLAVPLNSSCFSGSLFLFCFKQIIPPL